MLSALDLHTPIFSVARVYPTANLSLPLYPSVHVLVEDNGSKTLTGGTQQWKWPYCPGYLFTHILVFSSKKNIPPPC